MRILLAASASYDPPKGGSTRSNLVWLRALAGQGHECLVLCGSADGIERKSVADGVRIQSLANFARRVQPIADAVRDFDPTFVLVSSEDLSHSLLREAHRVAQGRLIYLAHTPQWFPFGPEAWHPDAEAAALLADALALVSIGEHMATYIEKHLGRKAEVVRPDLYGKGPWPSFAQREKQAALLINACTVKGLPIFLGLAKRFPEVRFLALKGWGTTGFDLAKMAAFPNIEVLETVASIDEAFAKCSVLLAPSLWYEGFGLVVTEAMLRGLPVLASDHGGLTEAASDSQYRLPVNPIERWLSRSDETGMPEALVPDQPLEIWASSLRRLLNDDVAYREESERVRSAAARFAAQTDARDLETLLLRLKPRGTKILLIHNSTYFPGNGGGDKSNRLLVEALVNEGHRLRVFTRLEAFGEEAERRHVEELAKRGIGDPAFGDSGISYSLGGATVVVITRNANLRQAIQTELEEGRPAVILASTDDPAHLLLEAALRYTPARLIYLVRATIALPFGPDASSVSKERTERLRRADAMVCVSEYVARYCRKYGGFDAVHVPISLADDANPPDVGRFENSYVTLVNPSAVKGLPILLQLADAMPGVDFAAVPSWGTTAADLESMGLRPNIHLLDPVDDITDILKRTRVTLVPSLWAEARSRMVLESLARGVPVIASDVGGLREAMCGVDYVLPVNPIVSYRSAVSDQMVPEAEVPPQDISAWRAALETLTQDRDAWLRLHDRSRAASLAYLGSLSVKPLDRIVRSTLAMPARGQEALKASAHLSPVKRKLLALRLTKLRRRGFFSASKSGTDRVFLFPWAAAGSQSWNFLKPHLPSNVEMLPAMLPGRESRTGEAFAKDMPSLVEELASEIERFIGDKNLYVLAGHSMGAVIAFEVARELRRRGTPPPSGLVTSSVRAPKIRRLFPASSDKPDDGLPVLLADIDLFQSYKYGDEPPLDIPISALMGQSEPSLEAWQMEAWREETSAGFRFETIPGDHFWLKAQPERFAAAILARLPLRISANRP